MIRAFEKSLFISIMFWAGTFFCRPAAAQESVLPSGYDIGAHYSLDYSDYADENIIHIHWSVKDNENFPLTGLYLSETIDSSGHVERYSVNIGGIPVRTYFTGAKHDQTMPGFDSYRWVIDFPGDSTTYNRPLRSGETLNLNYDIHADPSRGISLQFHTACFYGPEVGFFTVAQPLVVPPILDAPALDQWGLAILALATLGMTTMAIIKMRKADSAFFRRLA